MVRILKAKILDSQKIRALEKRVWDEEVVSKYDAASLVRYGYVYVAKAAIKSGDKIVGAIIASPTRNGEVFVNDLIVDKKYCRQKIGERLTKKLLSAAKGHNIFSFVMLSNIASIKLNLKLGAKIVRKIKSPYGLNEGYRWLVRFRNE